MIAADSTRCDNHRLRGKLEITDDIARARNTSRNIARLENVPANTCDGTAGCRYLIYAVAKS
jgi:hypothetical protein